jgi:serine beta-lactamase-like protein LACTB, mitochondrial
MNCPRSSHPSHPRVFRLDLQALFLVAVLALCAATSFSQSPEAALSKDKQKEIEAAVSKFMATTHTPGVSVAVVENAQYEWAQGFGLADLENNVPASEHTLYRLASISKSITATAAMQLWEQGKLDLDMPVQKYCPAFPQKQWPMTTREVMGHLAGIRHYKAFSLDDPEVGNTRHFDNPIQAGLNFFKNDPLVSQPGTSFHYSTQGYTLVGCVIEGASGSKYVDLVRQNVLAPAGMEQTAVDDVFAIIPYRTRFYQKTDSGTVENSYFLDSSYKIPGGGWISSAEDMARFEVALLNDKLVRRATRDLMWTILKPTDGKNDDYALGFEEWDENGIHSVGHIGGQRGTSTDFAIAPALRDGVVVLANMEDQPVHDLAQEVLRIVVGIQEKK